MTAQITASKVLNSSRHCARSRVRPSSRVFGGLPDKFGARAMLIQLGLARDRARRENDKDLVSLRQRFASLSPREREIVIQVARGRLSKQIAHDIGIAEATVKVHRSRAMQKMQAGSLPELGRMADKLNLVPDTLRRS